MKKFPKKKVNIERVLMPFAKPPKTNMRTDILPNPAAVFIMLLPYQSVIIYRRIRPRLQSQTVCTPNGVGSTA